MKTLVLDIETKPNEKLVNMVLDGVKAPKNYKDEAKILAFVEDKKQSIVKTMATDVDYSEIKVIGIKIDDEPAKLISLQELIDMLNEHIEVRAETSSEYEKRVLGFRLITFNGKKFDLPIIIREAIRKGLDAPYRDLKDWSKKYQSYSHIDLWEIIGDGEGKSLDAYGQIYLGEAKKEIDFDTCSDQELEEHCLADCELTYKLYGLFHKLV